LANQLSDQSVVGDLIYPHIAEEALQPKPASNFDFEYHVDGAESDESSSISGGGRHAGTNGGGEEGAENILSDKVDAMSAARGPRSKNGGPPGFLTLLAVHFKFFIVDHLDRSSQIAVLGRALYNQYLTYRYFL
jgi:hypothetical protein